MVRLGIVLATALLVCGCSTTDGFKKEVSVRESFGCGGTGQKYEVKWYRK